MRDIDWIVKQWKADIERFSTEKRFEVGEYVRVNDTIAIATGLNPSFIWQVQNCDYPVYEIGIPETDIVISIHEEFLVRADDK